MFNYVFFLTTNPEMFLFSFVKTQQWHADSSPPGMKMIRTSSSSSPSALTFVLSPPAGQCTWVWLWAWGRSPSSCVSQVLLCSGDTWGGGRTPLWQTAAARLACNLHANEKLWTHTHTMGAVCFMALWRFNVFFNVQDHLRILRMFCYENLSVKFFAIEHPLKDPPLFSNLCIFVLDSSGVE